MTVNAQAVDGTKLYVGRSWSPRATARAAAKAAAKAREELIQLLRDWLEELNGRWYRSGHSAEEAARETARVEGLLVQVRGGKVPGWRDLELDKGPEPGRALPAWWVTAMRRITAQWRRAAAVRVAARHGRADLCAGYTAKEADDLAREANAVIRRAKDGETLVRAVEALVRADEALRAVLMEHEVRYAEECSRVRCPVLGEAHPGLGS